MSMEFEEQNSPRVTSIIHFKEKEHARYQEEEKKLPAERNVFSDLSPIHSPVSLSCFSTDPSVFPTDFKNILSNRVKFSSLKIYKTLINQSRIDNR